MLKDLSESDLDAALDADSWTIRQIVHHIVDGDDLTKNIIKAALGGSGSVYRLEWYDPNNTWAETLDYASRPIAPAIVLLRANHGHVEQLMRHLPDAWERYVMFKRFETADAAKVSAGQFLHGQTSHALQHIEEIRTIRRERGI